MDKVKIKNTTYLIRIILETLFLMMPGFVLLVFGVSWLSYFLGIMFILISGDMLTQIVLEGQRFFGNQKN